MICLALIKLHHPTVEEYLDRVLRWLDIGTPGYFALFAILLSCGLGVPIPEDIPLLVAGALIGSGHMSPVPAATLAWCGIIGGDCILYSLGFKYGLNITRVPVIGKHVTKPRILKAEALFSKYGVWVVAVGRLFAVVRGAMVIAAGTIRFSFAKFVLVDGLAALVSGGLFIWLGYKFGQNLHAVAYTIHEFGYIILAVLIVFLIGYIGYGMWRHRRDQAEAEEFARASAIAKGEPMPQPHQPL